MGPDNNKVLVKIWFRVGRQALQTHVMAISPIPKCIIGVDILGISAISTLEPYFYTVRASVWMSQVETFETPLFGKPD